MALEEAVKAYFAHKDKGPELDCWDTESGEPEDGAQRFASDWAWADWHEELAKREQAMRDLVRPAA